MAHQHEEGCDDECFVHELDDVEVDVFVVVHKREPSEDGVDWNHR